MVIFAIATLVMPYFKGRWKTPPWVLAAAVSLSRLHLSAHFPLDVIAGAGLGLFIGGVLNLVFGVPGNSHSARRELVNAVFLSICPDPHFPAIGHT